MEKTLFLEKIDGLMVEQIARDYEYSMNSRHFHESYELYFLLEGERYYFIDKETYKVEAGMLVVISRNQIHKTSMVTSSYHNRLLLQIDGEVFTPYMKAMGLPSVAQVFERMSGVVEYGADDWQQILHLLESLKSELQEQREGYEVAVRLIVIQLLLIIIRGRHKGNKFNDVMMEQDKYQARTAKHQTIREVVDYLLSHYDSHESQSELAARFFVSKSYLGRIFKEVTGFTLNEYQTMARIKESQRLLVETEISVTEISALAGFESITYFERVFKKNIGESPLKYRKRHRR